MATVCHSRRQTVPPFAACPRDIFFPVRPRIHRRWTLLLSLALIGWLWLTVVHTHHEVGDGRVGAHPTCDLCAGLDRTAPPPTNSSTPLLRLARAAYLTESPATAPTLFPVHAYSSRAPPAA